MASTEILVVDDDEDMREFLQSALTLEGFKVRTAMSGSDALTQARQAKPAVMIVDFMMPEMTGEDLCKIIKGDPNLRDIIIFVISARSDVQTKVRCFESGADEYLVKPVDPLEIGTRIKRFMEIQSPASTRHDLEESSVTSRPAQKEKYGPYRVEGLIGRGGMGQVYKGLDALLERPVAIKVLSKQLSASPQFVERFRREARLLASIDHPGIATIYTYGEENETLYFAMQWCSGGSLSELIQDRKRIDPAAAMDQLLQCSLALAAAAKKGIVHRDIKPSNLMLDEDGRIKLVDFGLAFSEKSDAHITTASEMLGTPFYMPPEQSKNMAVDHRSDIYSLGITFYHMLYGQLPFSGGSSVEVMIKHLTQPLPPYDDLGGTISRPIYQVIERMTQKEPSDRYQDYDSLIQDLLQIQNEPRRQAIPSEEPKIPEKAEVPPAEEQRTRCGPYVLEGLAGQDFIGKTYKGYDEKLQRYAAVKIVSRELTPDFLKNLKRRIQLLMSLNHPGIETVFQFDKDQDDYYLALEWCAGGSLANLVRKKGRLDLAVALPLIVQVAGAMAAAYRAGILHGSIRPNNLLFDEHQKIKIGDFVWANARFEGRRLNESGSHFMAPERANVSIDVRVDIYSLGIIFYYMLYGIVPFDISGIWDVSESLPPFDDLGGAVPKTAYTIMQKMTHPEPTSRYPDYESLIRDLENLQSAISPRPTVTVPQAQRVSAVPTLAKNDFFEMLCKLYDEGSAGVLEARWSVVQTKFLIRQREIILFESNQPAKNIWHAMAKSQSIRKEDIPQESKGLEAGLIALLEKGFRLADFKEAYHQLMRKAINEIFIWPVCDAKFFTATIQHNSFTAVRISDILLDASRGQIDFSLIKAKLPKEGLIRRTPLFEQLLSAFNLTSNESFLAYRVEGEDTSLEALQALTGFPEEKILRFIYLLQSIGAIELRSSAQKPQPTKRQVEPQYRREVVQTQPKPEPPPPPPPPTPPPPAAPSKEEKPSAITPPPPRISAKESKPKQQSRKEVAEQFFEMAMKKHEQGDYWHAAYLCQEAVNNFPDSKYYYVLADAYARHPRFQKDAEDAYHNAIRLTPSNVEFHVQLSQFYVDRKLLLRARTHCEKALALVPDHKEALEISEFLQTQKLKTGGCWCLQN